MRKVYIRTPQYRLDQLMQERSKWQRKLTIASNKLRRIQKQLDSLSQEHVNTLMGKVTNEPSDDSGNQ